MSLLSRNLRNYVVSLIVLVLCSCVYQGVASQLLASPKVKVVTPRLPTENKSLKQDLADLFPADAWELGDCKRLMTKNGALLFQNWKQISDDQWKLEPLTIVVGRGLSGEAAESPIVLNAMEGAEIQFAESLDMLGGGSAPPIKMGRMIGEVAISRQSKDDKNESLAVKTRNVWIDNQKVWTTDQINMRVGDAQLAGRDLTIFLAASATSATKAETPSTILDRMDLVYLEELRIPLDSSAQNTPRRIGTASLPNENGIVSIKCRNGLKYDFALDRLSLRDSIVVQRSIRGSVVDSFLCDTMDFTLRAPADRSIIRQGPLDWVEKVHATGHPAVINLGSYDFKLSAEEIEFDAIGGLLSAVGSQGIVVNRGPITANLARLAYQYDPDAPEDIGAIDVLGAGKVTVNDPAIMLDQFSWTEAFRMQPIGRTTLDAVKEKRVAGKLQLRVDGNIVARLSDGGTAMAGAIEGVLVPHFVDMQIKEPVAKFGTGPLKRASTALNQSTPELIQQPEPKTRRKMSLVPEVLHAMNAVSFDTSEAVAQMNQLSLYFEQSADWGLKKAKEEAGAPSNATSSGTGSSQNSALGGLASWVRQPKQTADLEKPVYTPRPQLSGDLVSAKLLMTPNGIEAKDVSIKGNVHVKHQVAAGQTTMPVEMLGDSMRLLRSGVSQSSGQNYLQLGSGPDFPALLKMDDGLFRGPVIKVWPSDNVIQVTGAGELKIPTEVLKQLPSTEGNDGPADALSKVNWTSTPYCRWGESMQFDGQTALLQGGVQIDAEFVNGELPWVATMNGDEMQIVMMRPIELMNRDSMAGAELGQVRLVQAKDRPVYVRAEQRSTDQSVQAVHLITARELVFAPVEGGRLLGSGPGWYRGWMLTDKDSSILSPKKRPDQDHLGGQVLQGVHLTFRESMQGDLNQQTLAFTGGVRSGVRKLQSWQEQVDVMQMDRLAVGEMTMNCRQLQFGIVPGMPDELKRIPGMPTPWQMTAEQGVVVRANTETRGLIEGTATRASYESKKAWLVVEGAPGRSAEIRQTWPDGRKGSNYHSPKMAVNFKTFEFTTIMQDVQLNNVTLPGQK